MCDGQGQGHNVKNVTFMAIADLRVHPVGIFQHVASALLLVHQYMLMSGQKGKCYT